MPREPVRTKIKQRVKERRRSLLIDKLRMMGKNERNPPSIYDEYNPRNPKRINEITQKLEARQTRKEDILERNRFLQDLEKNIGTENLSKLTKLVGNVELIKNFIKMTASIDLINKLIKTYGIENTAEFIKILGPKVYNLRRFYEQLRTVRINLTDIIEQIGIINVARLVKELGDIHSDLPFEFILKAGIKNTIIYIQKIGIETIARIYKQTNNLNYTFNMLTHLLKNK